MFFGCVCVAGALVLSCVGLGVLGTLLPRVAPDATSSTVPYEVMVENRRADGKYITTVLVDEKVSKADALRLAESLWSKGVYYQLTIVDSRAVGNEIEWEAHNMRDNPRIPQEEMDKHCLLQCMKETTPQIRWFAPGRDH
jgi:hypothetical protein